MLFDFLKRKKKVQPIDKIIDNGCQSVDKLFAVVPKERRDAMVDELLENSSYAPNSIIREYIKMYHSKYPF